MIRKLLASAILASAAVACAPISVTLATAFDPAAHAYVSQAGTGRIDGQAFLRQAGGMVVTAAGETVELLPVTPYTTELLTALQTAEQQALLQGTTATIGNRDPRLEQYTRRTTADAQGNFSFTGLPPGDYYVHTEVRWLIPGQFGPAPQGGHLFERFTLAAGQSLRVILTR